MRTLTLITLTLFSLLLIESCDDSTGPESSIKIEQIVPDTTYQGFPVKIIGKNFGTERGESSVSFNGVKASNYISWTNGEIKVYVPENATTGKVKVKANNENSNGYNLVIQEAGSENPPHIDYIDKGTAKPREEIGIRGENFYAVRGASYVEFEGESSRIPATDYTKWSDDLIIVKVPTGAATGDVIVYVRGQASNRESIEIQEDNILLEQSLIPAGSFRMGTADVEITKPFYMSKYEITYENWKSVMFQYPPAAQAHVPEDLTKPIARITWYDAIEFCNELSKRERFEEVYEIDGNTITADWDANGYRLPTEAEWEYAARAGGDTKYGKGEDGNPGDVQQMAWHVSNSNTEVHPVGQKQANAYMLYDMLGNVSEWCWDWFGAEYYSTDDKYIDPRGPENIDGTKVIRGGSYMDGVNKTTVTYRFSMSPSQYQFYLGFRVVRNAE